MFKWTRLHYENQVLIRVDITIVKYITGLIFFTLKKNSSFIQWMYFSITIKYWIDKVITTEL